MVESTISSYNLISEDYDRRTSSPAPAYLGFRERFLAALPASGSVADLGCGPGRDAAFFLGRGRAVIGLDASVAMARLARDRGVPVALGDLRTPPYAEATLVGAWSSASLLHVPRADVGATLASWHRCLRPGAVLGLSTSMGADEGWEQVPYEATAQPYGAPLRRWFVHHEREALLAAVAEAGFTVTWAEERVSQRRWLMLLAERDG